MGVNFSKHGIDPKQSINDKLRSTLEPQLSGVKNRASKVKESTDGGKQINHKESEKVISNKASLLTRPEKPKNNSGRNRKKGSKREKPDSDSGKKNSKKRSGKKQLSEVCRFEHKSMTPAGVLYDPYQEGNVTVIEWNVDHPFYDKVMKKYSDEKGVVAGVDFLIYSLASAEIKEADTEEKIELLLNLRTILSKNLRILLS
jgi:hypothetical protein